MKLSSLQVSNYRGLRDIEIPLSQFVCITGENNSGKSSILQCLSLFLSGSPLKETDYFDPAIEVTITLFLSDLSETDLQLLAEEHRERIRGVIVDGKLALRRRYSTDRKSTLGYIGLTPKEERFGADAVIKLLEKKKGKGLIDAAEAAFPELKGKLEGVTTQSACKEAIEKFGASLPTEQKEHRYCDLPTGLDKSVIPMLPERIYIPAVKDLSDETKTTETSSFGKILTIVMKAIEPLLAVEKDLFEKLSKKLTRIIGTDGTVEDVRLPQVKQIESTIERFVRESFANVSLEIEIPPPELRSVLATARILADDGVKGPVELKGDGLRRAVVFSILRAYVEFARASDSVTGESRAGRGYLLLFEEPELFLHPDAQKILFEALGVFSKQHHAVVTTHSPLFLGPEATATFIRLSKTTEEGVSKAFSRARHIDLSGISPRDEFQIICYENNNAAFFAKRIVLVEGDSDFIVFPHIASNLNPDWNPRSRSVTFVRVGGKGSISRYRKFFSRFDIPVAVVADLDALEDDFDKLNPSEVAKTLRTTLMENADAEVKSGTASPRSEDIRRAHENPELKVLWEAVRKARKEFEADSAKGDGLNAAVEAFFAWEKKRLRRDVIREAATEEVKAAKLALIWELRKKGVFILERGALDDYYPETVIGPDKPSRAQAFIRELSSREKILLVCPKQTSPTTGTVSSEFDLICQGFIEGKYGI